MADKADATAVILGNRFPGRSSLEQAELRLHGSLDLAEITRVVMDAAAPGLADSVAVFAVERLFRAGEPMRSGTACRIAMRRLGTLLADEDQHIGQEEFPAGEVVVFDDDSQFALCVRNCEPRVFTRPDGQTLDRASRKGRKAVSRYASFLAVPLISDGYATGFLALARTSASPAFGDADIATAARLAAGAGTGIANALTVLRQRSLADALQRSLLAADPVTPPGIEAAARCLPATEQFTGGDWYDLFELPGGRSGIIVGDVMGHGPEAAAVMAQLRSAANALAQLAPEPEQLLAHLDRTTSTFRQPVLATCAYVVIDPASQSCVIAAAGHLPPVLAMPDGSTVIPDLPGGQFLGLGSAVYGQTRVEFPPGAVIALYTDGLVETRTRSFDQGIRALRCFLARQHGALETVCDALVASLAQRCEDDVTVVLARIPDGPASGEPEIPAPEGGAG